MHILGLIALAVTALWIAGILWRVDDWKRDWSENHASISSTATDAELLSPVFSESPLQVSERLTRWVKTQPRWAIASTEHDDDNAHDNDNDIVTLHLTRTTLLFRFTDDIHVRLEPVAGGTRLTAESQSRLGKGDLGQNPRNLKELLAGLGEKV